MTVDGRRIDDSNIVEQFEWCKSVIEHEQDEIDHEHVLIVSNLSRQSSIQTIVAKRTYLNLGKSTGS